MNQTLFQTMRLDPRSGLPIYIQIIEQIKQQIADGRLHPGDQLPTVRALAQELRVNFNTVARAYRMLDESGVISTQQGRGTYITERTPPELVERLRHEALAALARRFIAEARAYRMLDESGVISTQQGRGTYITERTPPELVERLRHEALAGLARRFIAEARRLGFTEPEMLASLQARLALHETGIEEGE